MPPVKLRNELQEKLQVRADGLKGAETSIRTRTERSARSAGALVLGARRSAAAVSGSRQKLACRSTGGGERGAATVAGRARSDGDRLPLRRRDRVLLAAASTLSPRERWSVFLVRPQTCF